MKFEFTKEQVADLVMNLEQCRSEGYLNFGDPAYSAFEMMELALLNDEE